MNIVKAPYIMFLGMVLSVAQARNSDIDRRVYDPGKGKAVRGIDEISASGSTLPTGISQSSTGTLTASGAMVLNTATASKSCLGNGTQAMVQCLFDSTKKECTGFGGGCAVLGRYLPVAPDDVSACIPDVTLAAEVCANCNGTQEGYDLYNRYLNACTLFGGNVTQQSGSGSVAVPTSTSLPNVPQQAETKATGARAQVTAAGGQTVTSGVASRQTSLSGVSGPQTTTGGQVKGTSGIDLQTTPSGEAGTQTGVGETKTTGGRAPAPTNTRSSDPVSATSDRPREGSLPPSVVVAAQEGLITAIPTRISDNGVVMGEDTPISPSSAGNGTMVITGSSLQSMGADLTVPTSVLSLATTTGSPAISTGKVELDRALNAVKLFFDHDIDESCTQDEDGCTEWQSLIEGGARKAICQSSAFQQAMGCSACVGAAGKSDQSTYQAQMEAYGWYKNNCTLAGGEVKTASGNGLAAIESVDGLRDSATGTGKTAAASGPAKAKAAADQQPQVEYVAAAAMPRSVRRITGVVFGIVVSVLSVVV